MLGSILAAVAGPLVGGLFSRNQKSSTTQNYLDYEKIREDGTKAGFNPLTALAAASGAGSGTSTTTQPALSTANFLADIGGRAAGAFADSWFNREQDAQDQEVERIKVETMRAELANINARTQYLQRETPFGSSIPKYESDGQAGRARFTGPVLIVPPKVNDTAGMEPVDRRPLEGVTLTKEYRTGVNGGPAWYGLNDEAFEMGPGEMIGGAIHHGGAYLATEAAKHLAPTGPIFDKDGNYRFENSTAGQIAKWAKRQWDGSTFGEASRNAYRYLSKPGRKSLPALNGGFMN